MQTLGLEGNARFFFLYLSVGKLEKRSLYYALMHKENIAVKFSDWPFPFDSNDKLDDEYIYYATGQRDIPFLIL